MSYTLSNEVKWLPNGGWDTRLHIAANADLVMVYLVVTQRFVILIDTLLNPVTAAALAARAQPFLDSRQLLVINTHSDWDHAWGNQLFAGANAPHPAPIIGHAQSAMLFDDPETLAFLHESQHKRPDIFGDVILTKPTITFTSDLWIEGGDLTLHLFATPGHMPDHISIFIPEISTLLAGDAAELPFPVAENAQSLPQLRASLAKLASLNATSVFYCHAPPTTGPRLIQDNIAYFDTLEATCRSALAEGFNPADLTENELAGHFGERYSAQDADQILTMLTWLQQESSAGSE